MLIKKLITTVQEESFEVGLPMYLKDRTAFTSNNFLRLTEKGCLKAISDRMLYFEPYGNAEKEVAKLIHDYDPCTEEEFFEHYNAALATIHSNLFEPTLA